MKKQIPDIMTQMDALSVTKENGTAVGYFLFDTFEVHTNTIPAGCVQDWHAHKEIEEIIVVNKGSLCVEWIDDLLQCRQVAAGELIRMNKSIHRISNPGKTIAECTIFRFVPPKENQAAVIKNDKQVFSEAEAARLLRRNKDEK
ncbi:cupin domain-containing protein [Enterococcus sp. LJL128]